MEKLKLKLNTEKINLYFHILTAVSVVVLLTIVSLFLYRNFYQTITQSEEILILQGKVASDVVNMNKFNKILEKIKNKTESRKLGEIKNPFD